jgi:thiamine biosynthesis protein ThiS
MDIMLNGEKKVVPDGITIHDLLEFLAIKHGRVAVERNEQIVKKDVYGTTAIKEGDSLEVVSFMAGGSGISSKFRVQCSKWTEGVAKND